MIYKYLYLILSGVFLLVSGCSRDSLSQSEGETFVSFSCSGIGGGLSATTRGESFAKNATVRVVVYKGTSYVADHTYKADASGNLIADAGEMRLIEDTYDFYAVSPALAIVSKTIGGPTFTVNHNVDFAAVKVNKQVTAYSGSNSTTKCVVALGELARKCAKVSFAVDLAGDVPFTVTKTVITEVLLSGMPASLIATGVTLPAGSGSETLIFGSELFKTDSADSRKASGSTIVLPKTIGTFNLTMKARFNGVTSITTLFPATGVPAMSFDAGKAYTFTVKLTKDNLGDPKLGLWLTVSAWTTNNQDYGMGGVPDSGDITTQLLGEWKYLTWESGLGDLPAGGSILTGVSGWWANHYDTPHLGGDNMNSND